MTSALPIQESARLKDLREIGIMDTPAEAAFDGLVHLAAEICEMPIGALSIVDSERLWFKSIIGSDLRETPRHSSFGNYTILSDKALIVPDATQDRRFMDSPVVTGAPHIRYYAGVPLILSSGSRIGALAVTDRVPRSLSPFQISSLVSLAAQAVALIEAKYSVKMHHERIMSSTRISTLGQMASGIAHEINNPLAIVLARAEELRFLSEQGKLTQEQIKKIADSVENTAMRIAKTVKSIRAFSKGGEQEKCELSNLSSIFDDVVEISKYRAKHSQIEFRVHRPDPAFEVVCRPTQISQVLLNLVNNAFDALQVQNGGMIELNHEVKGDTVEISVADNGPGIPPSLREKISQPFFTTKPSGQGMGLGLAISKQIVSSHGGELFLDQSNAQTRFVVRLPNQVNLCELPRT